LFPPALTTGYGTLILYPVLMATALLLLGLTLLSAFSVYQRSSQMFARIVIVALVGTLLFFLPYILWALDSLPNYTSAMLFALALGAAALFVGGRSIIVVRGMGPQN
jgi:hypothetical protein